VVAEVVVPRSLGLDTREEILVAVAAACREVLEESEK
jgi:hypothetical protein